MMRYITYEIIKNLYKVTIKPGKAVGFGITYIDAVNNALRFEQRGLFAVQEVPTTIKTQVIKPRLR